MCKLAAYINFEDMTLQHEKSIDKMLEHLFYINSYGQTDGSGVMVMDSKGEFDMHKRALPSPDFINTSWYKGTSFASKRFAAFHTRYSTVGANSNNNSHPFLHGNIALMQNGTVSGSHKNLVAGKFSPCEVDSDSVAWSFNEQGVEETLKAYRGAGVFMFMDLSDNTFNIIKNDERTLHFLKVRDMNTVIVATDAHALALAATRSKVPFDKIEEVKNDHWHKWGIDKSYTSVPLKIQSGFNWNDDSSWTSKNFGGNAVSNLTKSDRGNTLVMPMPKKKDPITEIIFEEPDEYLADCVWCSSPIHSSEEEIGFSPTTRECCCKECLPIVESYYGKEEWKLVGGNYANQ